MGNYSFACEPGGELGHVAERDRVHRAEVVLDGATLANICLGKITYWDDAAIKKLNPSLNLPHLAIATVHRADGSGTNFIFTNYLSKMSPTCWAACIPTTTGSC